MTKVRNSFDYRPYENEQEFKIYYLKKLKAIVNPSKADVRTLTCNI